MPVGRMIGSSSGRFLLSSVLASLCERLEEAFIVSKLDVWLRPRESFAHFGDVLQEMLVQWVSDLQPVMNASAYTSSPQLEILSWFWKKLM